MKSKTTMTAGYVLMAGILIFSFYGLGQSLASGGFESDDHDLDHEYHEEYEDNGQQVAAAANPMYAEECGSCHMGYPAMLLPSKSWQKIMAGLENHFGESAELDTQTRQQIESYLVEASARRSYRKLFRNLGELSPTKITELPYFVHEHDEIPARLIAGNDKVKSLSQCNACHRGAERGRFDEDDVVIPGFGRWDD
ncbi:MAG: hypothetical protein GY802_22820 [Gammaproteobacteria bacterium]|nr:hypothetical protein [Gammaproteobacteria bacterium]